MFNFALEQMKIRHVAAEKIGNGVFFTECMRPRNFSSSRNCGLTKIVTEGARRALLSSTNSLETLGANLDLFIIHPSHIYLILGRSAVAFDVNSDR